MMSDKDLYPLGTFEATLIGVVITHVIVLLTIWSSWIVPLVVVFVFFLIVFFFLLLDVFDRYKKKGCIMFVIRKLTISGLVVFPALIAIAYRLYM